MEPADLVLLALRAWIGVVMVAHGWNHMRSPEGTTKWFRSVGFRHAGVQARASGVGEVAVGAGLVLGFVTPVAAAGLIAVMTVAFWSIHRFAGFFVFARPDEGYEYVVTLTLAALAIATVGPGSLSLDAALGLDALTGWTGTAIAASGFLVAAIQLVAFWRRPSAEGD